MKFQIKGVQTIRPHFIYLGVNSSTFCLSASEKLIFKEGGVGYKDFNNHEVTVVFTHVWEFSPALVVE